MVEVEGSGRDLCHCMAAELMALVLVLHVLGTACYEGVLVGPEVREDLWGLVVLWTQVVLMLELMGDLLEDHLVVQMVGQMELQVDQGVQGALEAEWGLDLDDAHESWK